MEALAKVGRASGQCALYPGLESRRESLNTYARRNGIPYWNRTSLCGFANRRLICSANGIEIESAGESFRPRLRRYLVLASLNRPLFANKVRNYRRHRRIETDNGEQAAVVRIGEGEAVGGHVLPPQAPRLEGVLREILRAADCEVSIVKEDRKRRDHSSRP